MSEIKWAKAKCLFDERIHYHQSKLIVSLLAWIAYFRRLYACEADVNIIKM